MIRMKAFYITGPQQYEFRDIPMPRLQTPTDVLVKVKAAGICGSDIHSFNGDNINFEFGRIPGHEITAEVVEIGPAVTTLRPGDRVVHEIMRSCGKCYACLHGQPNVCKELTISGVHRDGGFCEYMVADQRRWHRFPESIAYDDGVMMEPYTIGAHAVSRGRVLPGDDVLIYGAGPIGLSALEMAIAAGARVFISDIAPNRLELAKDFGAYRAINSKEEKVPEVLLAETGGNGPNVVIDCAGLTYIAGEALKIITPAGRFVQVAYIRDEVSIPIVAVGAKEVSIIGSRLEHDDFESVIKAFPDKLEHVKRLISHRFPFAQAGEAFMQAVKPGAQNGKIVVVMD